MKHKKNIIGIITFHSAINYGAVLQAYALQNTIKKMYNECEIINFRNKDIERPYKVWYMKFKHHNIKHNIKTVISKIIYFPKNLKRYKVFWRAIKDMLNLSVVYKDEEKLKRKSLKYNIYIAGSDQIWNTDITKGLKDSYTLNFGDEKAKRISYAASIGKNDIIGEEEKFKEKLEEIDYISVREENAKEVLRTVTNKDIEVVLDPTFLLKKGEWESSLQNCRNIKQKYILAYVVSADNEYVKIVNYLAKQLNLGVVHFGRKDIYDNVLSNEYTSGPLDFVNLIKNAEIIVTTSFHATAFSLIFNKKFFVVPNKKTGTRVTNLLEKLKISDRVVSTLEEMKTKSYDSKIDYHQVNSILQEQIEKSIDFLKTSIES